MRLHMASTTATRDNFALARKMIARRVPILERLNGRFPGSRMAAEGRKCQFVSPSATAAPSLKRSCQSAPANDNCWPFSHYFAGNAASIRRCKLSQFLSVCLGDAVPLDCGPVSLDFIGKRLELARNVLPYGH